MDDETRLYYYGVRFYDPEFGRWTQRDPLGELGGIALYLFALNRPTSAVDGKGEIPLSYDGIIEEANELVREFFRIGEEFIDDVFEEVRHDVVVVLRHYITQADKRQTAQFEYRNKVKLSNVWEGQWNVRISVENRRCETRASASGNGGYRAKLKRFGIYTLWGVPVFDGSVGIAATLIEPKVRANSDQREQLTGTIGGSVSGELRYEYKVEQLSLVAGVFAEAGLYASGSLDLATKKISKNVGAYARGVFQYGVKVGKSERVARKEFRVFTSTDPSDAPRF